MKRIRQHLILMVILIAVLLSLGTSHAATWDISSFNDGLRIDDAGKSVTTGFPYGETSWVIRYGSPITNNFDPMWKEWFWYRIGTTDKEVSFSTLPATGVYNAGSSAVTLTFNDPLVPARFKATVNFGVTGKPTYSYNSTVKKTITIQNLTAAELDYHLFSYSDLDISSGGVTDNVAIVNGERALQTGFDAVGVPVGRTLIQTSTLKPSAYSIDTLSANPGSILDSLDKTGPTKLANDGGPYFQNTDMQFAFQYDLKIPANGSVTFDITNNMVETKPLHLTYSQAGAACATYAGNATYQTCVDNTTNTAAVNNVVVSGNLVDPVLMVSNLTFVSATDSGVYDATKNTITWTLPTLAAGATKCFQATVGVNSTTAFSTSAMVYSDEAFPAKSSATTILCNYPPRVTSIAPTTALTGVPYTYQITVTDVENDPINFTLVKSPVGMTMDAKGLISWTPTYDQQNTSYQVGVDVSDGHSTIHYTFAVAVKWQNMAPTAPVTQTANAVVNQPLSYQVLASDPDKQPLTYTTTDPLPVGLTLSSTGLLSGTPTTSGLYVVNVTVADTWNASVKTAVVINVAAAVILPPTVAAIPNFTITAPVAFNYSVSASDPQVQVLSYRLSSTPAAAGLAINSTTGAVSWPASVAGAYAVTVTATNTSNLSASQTFTLTVNSEIKSPIVSPIPNATITAPAAFNYTVIASDPQGQSLAYTLPVAPTGMTISATGVINWSSSVAGNYNITARVANTTGRYTDTTFTLIVTANKQMPVITWAVPAAITYGTALSGTQLNATASVVGTFVYTPAAGVVPNAGTQTLLVDFTPADTATYSTASKSVLLAVAKSAATVTLGNLSATYDGTAKAATATTSPVGLAVTLTYNGSATAPTAAGSYTVVATINDTSYTGSATGTLVIAKATPTITWATPAAIYLGTSLSATQLNATGSVPGSFTYTPASGTIMNTAGNQTLSVVFTPTDTVNYGTATTSVTLVVNNKTNQTINAISFTPNTLAVNGTTTVSATATSGLAVSFSSTTPAVCSVSGSTVTAISTGTCTIAANQAGNTTYNAAAQVTQNITVAKAAATVTLTGLSATYDGTAKAVTATTTPAGLAVAITYAGSATAPAAAGTYAVVATISDANYSGTAAPANLVIAKATPTITWATPAAIYLGTALSSTQLNATASVPGNFAYTPASGTVMNTAGAQTLSAAFTPTDTTNYNNASATVSITVSNKQNPVITWANPSAITYGTALSATQLNATANVAGSFTYTPASGTVLNAGTQTLSVVFIPTDTNTYNSAAATVILTVNKATPTITWPVPVIISGTPLTSAQLNATASVPGTFVYNPPVGTVLNAGSQTLSAAFTPTDSANYNNVTGTISLTVAKANPVISWSTPAAVVVGTPLSGTQLNATANVPGTFAYTPPAGTVMNTAGNQTLTVAFTPTDTANYNTANGSVILTVNPAPAQPPTMTPIPAATVNSGSAFSYQVAVGDPQGQPLSYKLAGNPVGMSISTTGLISWAKAVTGTYNVIVTATNTSSLSASQSLALTVVNQAPTMTAIPAATITAPAAFSYQVAATDPNGDALAYSLAGNPAGMTISSTGLINWTPSIAGTYTITATATDTGTLKASQSFTLTVNGGTVKQPPVITSTPATNGYKDGYYYYQVVASDPNGDALSYSLIAKPSGMTINSSTGLIYWHPEDKGTYSVTVKVTDASGLSASQSFKVTINDRPSNSSPRITSLPVTSAKVGVLYNYDVNATDSNGDILYYRLTTAPSGMVVDLVSGNISWTPMASQIGLRSVTVEAVDSKGGKSSQSYTIQVIDGSNNPPVITSSPITTAFVGRSYSYQVVASDPEGKSLTYSLVTKPSSYMRISSTGLITWTPGSYSLGNKTVTVRVSDGTLYTDQTYILSVTSPNTTAAAPLTIKALSVNNLLPVVFLNSDSN